MRKEKEYLLEEIADAIPQGSNLVLVNYGKMAPNTAHSFRRKIAKAGGRYLVVKKRISGPPTGWMFLFHWLRLVRLSRRASNLPEGSLNPP